MAAECSMLTSSSYNQPAHVVNVCSIVCISICFSYFLVVYLAFLLLIVVGLSYGGVVFYVCFS